ncbi:MAG: universal stress protein [Nitrospirae bacterium]|nr:universal stress protein [Nitrospirota bacterium]
MKLLIAVDGTKGSQAAFEMGGRLCAYSRPERVVLIYVEKFGPAVVDEMLGHSEMSALREMLQGTEYQETLDQKAETILGYYKKALESKGVAGVKTIVKEGHPADEILQAAAEEGVDLIVVGSRGKRAHSLLMGSVSREIVNRAEIPVLVVKTPEHLG